MAFISNLKAGIVNIKNNSNKEKIIDAYVFNSNGNVLKIPANSSLDIETKSAGESFYYMIQSTEDVVITLNEVEPEPPKPEEPTEISNIADLEKAISEGKTDVKLTSNLTVNSGNLDITGLKHFDGNNNTITFESTGQNFVSMTDGAVIENVIVNNTVANENWSSTYCIQIYNSTCTIKNCTAKGGNAGILVNSSNVTLEDTIDVSNNTFGGIEVSKSSSPGMNNSILNVNGATIVNTTEAYSKPTIWTDGEGQTVNGIEAMFANSEVKENQVQYYLVEENSFPDSGILVNGEIYNTLLDAINAVPNSVETKITLYEDVSVENQSLEIPSTKNIILNLNNHIISSNNFDENGRTLTNAGTLKITGNGKITAESCGTKGTGVINNTGILTIEDGTFNGGNGANGAVINNKVGATCTIKNGNFTGCPRAIQNLGTLTIDGGNFIGSDTYSGNEGNAIINAQGATCTINDGTFTGHMNAVSNMDNGGGCQLTINGGTFTTDGFEASGAIFNGLGNTVTIEDGTFTTSGNSGATIANKGTAIINGGTFQGDNVTSQVYTISSGQGASSNASIELGPDVQATGTFGALRIVSGTGTVKGGTYKVPDGSSNPFYALFISSSSGNVDVSVENGTFESPNNAVRCGESGFSGTCTLDISNGSFTSTTGKAAVASADPGVVSIIGGTYSSNVKDYVPEGYEISESDEGTFIVNKI